MVMQSLNLIFRDIYEWQSCKDYFDNSCCYCGLHIDNHYRRYNGKLRKEDLHKDHADHFGVNDLSNCIPACHSCNLHKWEFELKNWYNENNPNYTEERLDKITKWLEGDWEQFKIIK